MDYFHLISYVRLEDPDVNNNLGDNPAYQALYAEMKRCLM
jgi:hypothetical protein